jgi:hypothetical protein
VICSSTLGLSVGFASKLMPPPAHSVVARPVEIFFDRPNETEATQSALISFVAVSRTCRPWKAFGTNGVSEAWKNFWRRKRPSSAVGSNPRKSSENFLTLCIDQRTKSIFFSVEHSRQNRSMISCEKTEVDQSVNTLLFPWHYGIEFERP